MVKYLTSDGRRAAINTASLPDGWILSHNQEEGVWTIRLNGKVSRLQLFSGCRNLTWVEIPSSVWYIEDRCFENCVSLKEITLPEGVQYLGMQCFLGCSSLESVNLPSSLQYILTWSFQGCSSLKAITLPENVAVIAGKAFQGCSSLKEITVLSKTPPQISSDTFFSGSDTHEWWIMIPRENIEAYRADKTWTAFSNHFKAL